MYKSDIAQFDEKITEDRKHLRDIDYKHSKYSLIHLLGQVIILMAVTSFCDIYWRDTLFRLVLAIFFLFFAALQIILHFQLNYFYSRGPARYRQFVFWIHALQALFWNALILYAVGFIGDSSEVYLIIIFCLVNTMFACCYLMPYLNRNRYNLFVSLIPLSTYCLLAKGYDGFMLGLLLMITCLGLLKVVEIGYFYYWSLTSKAEQLSQVSSDLTHALKEAQNANGVKVDFVGNLTHEIRTPMNSVLGMISLLSDTQLDQNQHNMLSVASQSGINLLALIDDILDYSKISTGSISLDSNVFNLRGCIDEVVEPLGPLAHEKNIELNVVFDQNMPLRVRSDAARIAQITNNLIMNAIRFSEEGEVVVEVHLTRISNSKGLIRIHVTDEGVGISQDQQAKLFEAFHRTDSENYKSVGGAGLGLAICKGLVERMDGQIGLISELGKGSTFWFTLPVRLSTQQKQASFSNQKFTGCRALLINAPQGMQQGIKNDLEFWDIQFESIHGADRALQALRSSQREGVGFQVVILNLTMHYSGMIKLSRNIAGDPVLADIKQVLITTIGQIGNVHTQQHINKTKNLVFITKPITKNAMMIALTNLFEGSQRNKIRAIQPLNDQPRCDTRGTILLVEDNKVNQMVAKGILNKMGFMVQVVENGVVAVEILSDKRFDLILMDCQMPGLDGYEATEKIREMEQLEKRPRVPIIAMTAYAIENEITKCLACGMDDYLPKPINNEELDVKISSWLEKSRAVEIKGVLRFSQCDSDDPEKNNATVTVDKKKE